MAGQGIETEPSKTKGAPGSHADRILTKNPRPEGRSFKIYSQLLTFHLTCKKKLNMKLVILAMRRAHAIRKRINLICLCETLSEHQRSSEPTTETPNIWFPRAKAEMDKVILLLRAVY
jgi:hypothetical protein